MGKRSTTAGATGVPTGIAHECPAAAVMPVTLAIRGIDATLAAAGILTGSFMPIGAIPLRVEVFSAATGGTNPLLDVGA